MLHVKPCGVSWKHGVKLGHRGGHGMSLSSNLTYELAVMGGERQSGGQLAGDLCAENMQGYV